MIDNPASPPGEPVAAEPTMGQVYTASSSEVTSLLTLGTAVLTIALTYEVGIATCVIGMISKFMAKDPGSGKPIELMLLDAPIYLRVIVSVLLCSGIVVAAMAQLALGRISRRGDFARFRQAASLKFSPLAKALRADAQSSMNCGYWSTCIIAQIMMAICASIYTFGYLVWNRVAWRGADVLSDPWIWALSSVAAVWLLMTQYSACRRSQIRYRLRDIGEKLSGPRWIGGCLRDWRAFRHPQERISYEHESAVARDVGNVLAVCLYVMLAGGGILPFAQWHLWYWRVISLASLALVVLATVLLSCPRRVAPNQPSSKDGSTNEIRGESNGASRLELSQPACKQKKNR